MSAFTNTDPEAITKAGPHALESSGLIKQLEVSFTCHLNYQPLDWQNTTPIDFSPGRNIFYVILYLTSTLCAFFI